MSRIGICMGVALLATGIIAPAGSASSPAAEKVPNKCETLPRSPDGTYREDVDTEPGPGGLTALPPRVTAELKPGDERRYCVGFRNRAGVPVDIALSVSELGFDSRGNPVPDPPPSNADASPVHWVDIPTERVRGVAAGATVWVPVQVSIPDAAPNGSAYLALTGTRIDDTGSADRTGIDASSSVSVQLFLELPGSNAPANEPSNLRAPRVIWWDGAGIGDLPVLDRLRGLEVATVRFTWKNLGDRTDQVRGKLVVRSSLSGRVVAEIPIDPRVVLRGSSREFAATWSHDVPLLGRFTPTLELTDGAGNTTETDLASIWVIPAWWYVLALVCAVVLPVWVIRRSRRSARTASS